MEAGIPKVIDAIRFGDIGVVKYRNGFDMKFYIGVGTCHSEAEDIDNILKFGKPFILPNNFYFPTKN